MRTRSALAIAVVLLAGTAFAPAFGDSVETTAVTAPIVVVDKASLQQMRQALVAYRAGNKEAAAGLFGEAAARGHVPAQWKLARMLASGDGVAADPVRAASLYTTIADRFVDNDPALRLLPFVAHATREAGRMALAGKAGPRTVRAARRHLYRAATDYRDADARYWLALSLLDSAHGRPQPRVAANWLRAAIQLGHAAAGATLGEMQIAGTGMKAKPVEGLVEMARAVERANEAARPSLALRFQAARASVGEAAQLAAATELKALGLSAATDPIMSAANDGTL